MKNTTPKYQELSCINNLEGFLVSTVKKNEYIATLLVIAILVLGHQGI